MKKMNKSVSAKPQKMQNAFEDYTKAKLENEKTAKIL